MVCASAMLEDAPGDAATTWENPGVCASEVDRVKYDSRQEPGGQITQLIVGRSARSSYDPTRNLAGLPRGKNTWAMLGRSQILL